MLAVYRVGVPIVSHQCFLTEDRTFINTLWPRIHTGPLADIWKPPSVYIQAPRQKEGDFIGFLGGYIFAFAESLLKSPGQISNFFEQSGELLPLEHKGRRYLVFNCTNCLNVLNDEKSIGTPYIPFLDKYVFWPKRFRFSLFNIPQTRELLCVEGFDSPEDEFKGFVEENKLTGLIFEKLWSEAEDDLGDDSKKDAGSKPPSTRKPRKKKK